MKKIISGFLVFMLSVSFCVTGFASENHSTPGFEQLSVEEFEKTLIPITDPEVIARLQAQDQSSEITTFSNPDDEWTWSEGYDVETTKFFTQDMTVGAIGAVIGLFTGHPLSGTYLAMLILQFVRDSGDSNTWIHKAHFWKPNNDPTSPYSFYVRQVITTYGDANHYNFIGQDSVYYYSTWTW